MSKLALLICLLFILWLFVRDCKLRPMGAKALWIPLLWVFLIGSKGVSYWLGAEIDPAGIADRNLEGSPVDRAVFLTLIVFGAVVLWRRRIDWRNIFSANRWVFAFLFYCGLSVIWSEYPFVSLKRWTKELGNFIMVFIILTDKDPVLAIRAIFARYTYFALPLSLLFILFFPELGTHTDRWFQEATNIGITTNKNELGIVLVICGLFLVWDLLQMRRGMKTGKVDLVVRLVLMGMVAWLLKMANSSTAIVCFIAGAGLLLLMQFPTARGQVRYFGMYSLGIALLLFFLDSLPITESFVKAVGRDATFTGRTDIWAGLLKEPVDTVMGTGYSSFWLTPGIVDKYDQITQAHNGYLETYLNGGLVGLGLLAAMIFATAGRLKGEVVAGGGLSHLRFAVLVVAIFYNCTEAMFNGLNLIWFVFLIAALSCTQATAVPKRAAVAFPHMNRLPLQNRQQRAARVIHGKQS